MRQDAIDLGFKPLNLVILGSVEDGAPESNLGSVTDGFLDLGVRRPFGLRKHGMCVGTVRAGDRRRDVQCDQFSIRGRNLSIRVSRNFLHPLPGAGAGPFG